MTLSELPLPSIGYLFYGFVALAVLAFRATKGSRLRRGRFAFVALAIWTWAFCTPVVANQIEASLEAPYPEIVDPPKSENALIVVLSSGMTLRRHGRWVAELDRAGWERTYAAIKLWRRLGGELLFVGQPSGDPKLSVAGVMADVARASGVPEEAIHVETKSATTRENLRFSKSLIAAHPGDAWLVTSATHMRRAMAVASAEDLELRPFPCDHRTTNFRHWYAWLPSNGGAANFSEVWHEVVGLAWYRLRGYAE